MGKTYVQKFRSAWLKDPSLKSWLVAVESSEGTAAKCKLCNHIVTSRYADLKAHATSQKHKKHEKLFIGPNVQPKIPFQKESELIATREAEARLALFIAQHTSINVTDHLVLCCRTSFSKHAENLQMHRTKCSNIIKNVISPFFIKDLRDDIAQNKFSILIDESTDLSVNKYLGIVIIYYSNIQKQVVTSFLELAELTSCDAESIVQAIKTTFLKHNLSLNNLVGIGTDNASVMAGVNNGVYAKLKQEIPGLVLIRCVCHSLQLAVSYATKQNLPRNLEYIIEETYTWFSKSTLRQAAYKQIYNTLNNNHDPLKIVHACQTRWLSIESAVTRIYDQWSELKTHFSLARMQDKCYTAELLYSMYADNCNLAFFPFLNQFLLTYKKLTNYLKVILLTLPNC